MATNATDLTGDDLRLLRLAARLNLRDVARVYGVSRQRIAAIEAAARPTEASARRFVEAVREARDHR